MNDGSLEIRDVTVQFGGLTALDGVSLTARPRQITGIIGPNGAGKTTLLNTACGFVKPQSGTVSFDGRVLNGLRTHRLAGLGIARTLQGVGLFPGLSVAENVMIGATPSARAGVWTALFGLPRSDRDERRLREQAVTALDRLGVADLADRMPDTLSYGLRKRVALARALAAQPRLVLLDEPASGLPENELPELGDLIRDLATEAGVVVIEHRMDLVMSVCDTIFVLDFGKLIAQGSPAQVQADPAVTAAYLGAEDPDRAAPQPPSPPPDPPSPPTAPPDPQAPQTRSAPEAPPTLQARSAPGAPPTLQAPSVPEAPPIPETLSAPADPPTLQSPSTPEEPSAPADPEGDGRG
jgi:branched-chain amino acid transport system ATP-binding protein